MKEIKTINITDLINTIPDLLKYFVSGFVFMYIFRFLCGNNKKVDFSFFTIWCIVISYIITIIYQIVHTVVYNDVYFSNGIKNIIYIFTAIILSFVVYLIYKSLWFEKIFCKLFNKSVYSDVFDSIIDYKSPTTMMICLKSNDAMYIGKFLYREENGLDSWIVLIDYTFASYKPTYKELYNPIKENHKSTVAINLRDIQSIQLLYEPNSKIYDVIKYGEVNEDITKDKR